MLSHDVDTVKEDLLGEPRWDESFLDYLRGKAFTVLDMRDYHKAEWKNSKLEVDDYLKPYYNSHYAPVGNFFTAESIRDSLIDWLEEKPLPYWHPDTCKT